MTNLKGLFYPDVHTGDAINIGDKDIRIFQQSAVAEHPFNVVATKYTTGSGDAVYVAGCLYEGTHAECKAFVDRICYGIESHSPDDEIEELLKQIIVLDEDELAALLAA